MSHFENPYGSPGDAPTRSAVPPSGMAIASLVVGIVSILIAIAGGFGGCCCLGVPVVGAAVAAVAGLPAIGLGYFGMRECQAGTKSGWGLALAGMITGGVGVLISLIVVLAYAGLFAFALSNQPPQNF